MRQKTRDLYLYSAYALAGLLLMAAIGLVAAALWPRDTTPSAAGVSADSTSTSASLVATSTAEVPTSAPEASTTTSSTSTTVTAVSTTAAATTSSATAPAEPGPGFDTDLAMSHLKALAQGIGPRKSGTADEDAAVGYAAEYLDSLGYAVMITDVPLPNGSVSHNVQAAKLGGSDRLVVVGGHIDTAAGAPGANDNASGAAVVLELARCLRDVQTTANIEFVLFGAEEMIDSDPDHHHYGSRQFVADLTAVERSMLVGMISVDMVAYGTTYTIRNMKLGPQELTNMLLDYSAANGYGAKFLKDLGTYGWSDHEPFELAGYPVAWLEWRQDPNYHTSGDNWNHVKSKGALVERVGDMLFGFLSSLTAADLQSLADARDLS